MNRESAKSLIQSTVTLHTNDQRNFILHKIATTQGSDNASQEENGLRCDFYECFQEMSKAVSNIDIPDLTQEMIEELKP